MANEKKSANLLPALFRTDKNTKFLSATLDQLIQTPQLERINGWVGSTDTLTYDPTTDYYIPETLPLRKKYQLEPAVVVRDTTQKIKKAFGYDDLINQITAEGGIANRLDRLFKPEYYSYDPHIDWDKFINFDQYYWLPLGPTTVPVAGLQETAVSTYTLTDSSDGLNFILTPDGLTPNVTITLYKGVTYKFDINSTRKVWIKTRRVAGATQALSEGILNNGISNGTITLTVTDTTPLTLYYIAEDDKLIGGEIIVKSIQEDSVIDIEKEIIGKQTFTSGNGVTFTNGLNVHFIGTVTPAEYQNKTFIVEGVGDSIVLVDLASLETPEAFSGYYNENFDGTNFDEYPFDNFGTLPLVPEYITINRASQDKNPWSRYNRWVHKDVIVQTAIYNNVNAVFDQSKRASRPIVEFKPNMQLYNFGGFAKTNVHHIDTLTTDVFSNVEGQYGYYVDGLPLEQGDRVIFTADLDPMVNGKTYLVNFIKIGDDFKISLEDATDVDPIINDSILVTKGTTYQGTSWWYGTVNGVNQWIQSQQKTTLNQAPTFDIFDNEQHSYGDTTYYQSDFRGSKMFGYGIGNGSNDAVLGFPLQYKNIANQSYYLFNNYFMTDAATVVVNEVTYTMPISLGFVKVNKTRDLTNYVTVWTEGQEYIIPIIQTDIIKTSTRIVEITSIDNPGYQTINVSVFVNGIRKFLTDDYTLYATGNRYFVNFNSALNIDDRVLLKLYTDAPNNNNGQYEPSIGYTNNPLNGSISSFTLAELSDHVKSMADSHPDFNGTFFGDNNIRDLKDFNKYGTRLISNKTPAAFASYFIADKENSVISALRKSAQQYDQFKLAFLKRIREIGGTYSAVESVDIVLHNMNVNKDINFPYSYSDMIAYGKDVVTRTWTVTDIRNRTYSLTSSFDASILSFRSVLVYHTSITTGKVTQLIHGVDYTFDPVDATVNILSMLVKGDTIAVNDYASTQGCYVPPTPSKAGLYPKFVPSSYVDDTYANAAQTVIQCHDGSIMLAYGDYRDDIILELERRIYNNIKVAYNADLFDINEVMPGVFRNKDYGYGEISSILKPDFLRWVGFYGFDYELNDTGTDDPKTFNFKSANDPLTNKSIPGGWRGVYKYFYDTDRPHSHPWEMLGLYTKPVWWDTVYGAAPYTSGNKILWQDLENGLINDPSGPVTNTRYARPGLSTILPVNIYGELLDPASAGIAQNLDSTKITNSWMFGDVGPVEAAWRRSSIWPFAVQILLALTKPAKYCSTMFDPSRMALNLANQYIYNNTGFINPANIQIYLDTTDSTKVQSSGFSIFLIEINRQRNKNYITDLKQELSLLTLNLMNKVGGFVNKNKLDIIIDSVNPNTVNPGVTLPNEDYDVFLNQSNPIKSIGVSGIIVERTAAGYVLRGYDKSYPFFNCLMPSAGVTDPAFTVGGKTEPFLTWTAETTGVDVATGPTAVASNSYKFYQAGQLVFYSNGWYRVKTSHRGSTAFIAANFIKLPTAPRIGGVSVQKAVTYAKVATVIPYGKEFYNIQDLYYAIMGYGKWLETQGLVLDEYNGELSEIIDWNFTAKELLFWTTQNWAPGSVITLSPFASKLQFTSADSIVDNLLNNFYEYSVLTANGSTLSNSYVSTSREGGTFTIKTLNTQDGIYFIRLNFVQKEHAIVLNNQSLFGDVLYDIESGYRQRRVKLLGFRTAAWNGDMYSPGFIYDEANISDWTAYQDYAIGDVVRYVGNYYSASEKVNGSTTFDFTQWSILGSKPVAQLLPNLDYKINQFEDFYSLDIDNFDMSQQKMAQHLVGYTPRPYLDNIFVDSISQYKFYQGFIREKGTRNSVSKLANASKATIHGSVDYREEWAFRIGSYGAYSTEQNIEIGLNEIQFKENPQIIKFIDIAPTNPNDVLIYKTPADVLIKTANYTSAPFLTVSESEIDSNTKLPVAGYVRFDDITATALNKLSLLDIANNRSINEGDTIWVGYRDDNEWDVYRYSETSARIISASIVSPASTILLTTDFHHKLTVGDIISISQLETKIDGVYIVQEITALNQFIVASALTSIAQTLTPGIGLLFKFSSVRMQSFDDLVNYEYASNLKIGQKIWVDDNGAGKWSVYEKVDAYSSAVLPTTALSLPVRTNEKYGYKIAGASTADKWAITSPGTYSATNGHGTIFAYRKDSTGTAMVNVAQLSFNNFNENTYVASTSTTGFGNSLAIDETNDLIIAGAPFASYVKTVIGSTPPVAANTGTASALSNQGAVKITKLDFEFAETNSTYVLTSPQPESNAQFGWDVVQRGSTLIVSSPGQSGGGAVHLINYSVADDNTIAFITPAISALTTSTGGAIRFGSSISASSDATIIAVAAPNFNSNEGAVFVYKDSVYVQTINIASLFAYTKISANDLFAAKVVVDPAGKYLFITASNSPEGFDKRGKVIVMQWSGLQFVFSQVLTSPYKNLGVNFGTDICIDSSSDTLTVSGTGSSLPSIFDVASTTDGTTFDSNSVDFFTPVQNSGSAYTFNRYDTKYVFGQEILNSSILADSVYGESIFATENVIMVGAPGRDNVRLQTGAVYIFDRNTDYNNSWNLLREEAELVDLTKVRRAYTLDTEVEQVLDYLDIIDPVKGRISGIADQELKYKTLFDPAIYSLGTTKTINNTSANWIDEHVGELWWDLSTVKFTWYEQGDSEFRRNNWNSIFPGCTIDVYEWVRSTYLPNQWSAIADTNEGLVAGISGQPKYADNSVISVKQIFNSVSQSFTNVYYYWVKNKVTLPTGTSRKMNSFDVASAIADPKSTGLKYISFISSDALMLVNAKPSLIESTIHLAIDIDSINNDVNKHTEWLLLEENNARSLPNSMLWKKLIDSLLGRDSLGNLVPDPTLPTRLKYGVQIRPRQSMFKDRLSAFRILVEYINSVLSKSIVTGNYNFRYLNAIETIPDFNLGKYDMLFEDIIARDAFSARFVKQAALSCTVTNGRITDIVINDPGLGYVTAPTVTISGDGIDGEIKTEINVVGSIISAKIVSSGKNYITAPSLAVRPFTVIVQSDSTVNNKWSKYEWDYASKSWDLPVHVQSYDTTNYWKYIDWVAPTFNPAQEFLLTIDEPYQLAVLTSVPTGNYIKIRNAGDGRAIVVKKLSTINQPGSYNLEYDIVYQEKGTIQLLDSLWDYTLGSSGFDHGAAFDQTLFDQLPDIETENIINALKTDILIGDLLIYQNKLFFKLIKYALTEQKFLDWAFKTSFINVTNNAGTLDQRPTYKLNDTSYYESYINETKPYHTKVRNFQSNYTATDISLAKTSDFDLPSYYDTTRKQFIPVTFGDAKLAQEPYKTWFDNFTYFVESVDLFDGGTGYQFVPEVVIEPTNGDVITDPATAIAYISLGKVTSIVVTHPGSGYTSSPRVVMRGGGSTTITLARAGAKLANNKVRSNLTKLKFDRVAGYNEVTTSAAYDSFPGDGSAHTFPLTWLPEPNKAGITVTIDGILELSSNYSIDFTQAKFNGYTKQYALLNLSSTPNTGTTVTVDYIKNVSLYNAVDRIRDYYAPTSGMPGNTATMLMSGLEYPGVTLDTLPFQTSLGWDTAPWDNNSWDDFTAEVGLYEISTVTNTTSTFILPYIPESGQRINVYINGYRVDDPYYDLYDGVTVQPNGRTTATSITRLATFVGNSATNYITFNPKLTTTSTISFRYEDSDGTTIPTDVDLDTLIYGGSIDIGGIYSLSRSDDYNDVNIDGDGFNTVNNSYGPEENLPGRVLESIGISVYTKPSTANPLIVNRKYFTDDTTTVFSLGIKPSNTSAVQVLYDNTQLHEGSDYTIDFTNNTINLLVETGSTEAGPYFSTDLITPRRQGAQYDTSVDVTFNQDDDYQGPLDIGFEWNMFGTKFTQLYVSTNGFITFGGGSAMYTPVYVGAVPYPAIYAEYTDLWQGYGASGQLLSSGEVPGIYITTGSIGTFQYWRMRFQGSHYIERDQNPAIPTYDYECTLYSDGTNQYIETIYEIIPSTVHGLGVNDIGAVFGVAQPGFNTGAGAGLSVSPALVNNNSSHVFYSTSNGGNWLYAGQGSFDPNRVQYTTGTNKILSLTTVGVGAGYIGTSTNIVSSLLEYGSEIASTGTTTIFAFATAFTEVGSSYVTVNGIKSADYIVIGTQNNYAGGRASIRFNTPLSDGDVIQAWLFSTSYKSFSEIKEQVISTGTQGIYTFDLIQPPGNIKPYHSQIIVEFNGRKLTPPDTLYFAIENNQLLYPLDSHFDYPVGMVDAAHLEVYINGTLVELDRDYELLQYNNAIQFRADAVKNGDAIAIVNLINHDYEIQNNRLVLTSNVDAGSSNNIIRIITFTDHDSSSIRKERFPGTVTGRYLLSRKVLNSNYVWVEVNGRSLTQDIDYRIDTDKQTLVLNFDYILQTSDNVTVMSFADTVVQSIIGYRIFKDILGRTTYKRLSEQNSTQLAVDLLSTSTSITVVDGTVLTPPNPARKLPGVILINGERIEFFAQDVNVLSLIKRGTFGTGVRAVHPATTTVVDQSPSQTLPVYEYQQAQTIKISGTTDEGGVITYFDTVSTLTSISVVDSTATISLNSITFDATVSLDDQISVYYRGTLLTRPHDRRTVHLPAIAYDSNEVDSFGIASDIELPADYYISTTTNHLVLNFIPAIGAELKIVRNTAENWLEFGKPMHESNTEQVKFLLERPASLPDKYHYGQ